ncbi:hypothetical protein D3C72_1353850 [compost metagenome]
MAAITAGSPWYTPTSTGTPTPPVITGKAAKPLPMMMVNRAMPSTYTATATKRMSMLM